MVQLHFFSCLSRLFVVKYCDPRNLIKQGTIYSKSECYILSGRTTAPWKGEKNSENVCDWSKKVQLFILY